MVVKSLCGRCSVPPFAPLANGTRHWPPRRFLSDLFVVRLPLSRVPSLGTSACASLLFSLSLCRSSTTTPLLHVYILGGVPDSHLPICDAVCAAGARCHPAGSGPRHHLLPQARPGAPGRPAGTTSHALQGEFRRDTNSVCQVHWVFIREYRTAEMLFWLVSLYRYGWMRVPRYFSHMESVWEVSQHSAVTTNTTTTAIGEILRRIPRPLRVGRTSLAEM